MANILNCDSCKKYFISSEKSSHRFDDFCYTCI